MVISRKRVYEDLSKEELIDKIMDQERGRKYGLVWDVDKIKEVFETESEGKVPILREISENKLISTPPPPPRERGEKGKHSLQIF